jgi:hypothetical protein
MTRRSSALRTTSARSRPKEGHRRWSSHRPPWPGIRSDNRARLTPSGCSEVSPPRRCPRFGLRSVTPITKNREQRLRPEGHPRLHSPRCPADLRPPPCDGVQMPATRAHLCGEARPSVPLTAASSRRCRRSRRIESDTGDDRRRTHCEPSLSTLSRGRSFEIMSSDAPGTPAATADRPPGVLGTSCAENPTLERYARQVPTDYWNGP